MDQIDSKSDSVTRPDIGHIVADLILLLVAFGGEEGNGRGKLIVAESLEPGNCERGRTKRKGQSESKIRIALLREMQAARADDEPAEPRRTEDELVAEGKVEIVVVSQQASGGQCSLLHQVVVRRVVIDRAA